MLVPQAPRLRRQKPRPPTETSSTTVTNKPAEPEADKEKSSLDVEDKSSTTAAERQAMLDEADALTRDEREK